jgi:K+-sensing histidine kinase KdpD
MARILVVDDEKQMRDLLVDTLHSAGHSTLTAANGSEGLAIALEQIPDLIITDVNMPRMDGFQMLDRIRMTEKINTIPVIFLTAENNTLAMRKGMLGGAEDFIAKPVSPHDLLLSVEVQLGKRAALEEQHHSTLQLLRRNIAYTLPHELRTPLHMIAGYAKVLEMEGGRSLPEDVLESAHMIKESAIRLERLIENYLIYAQLEILQTNPAEQEAAQNHLVKDCGAIIEKAAVARAEWFNRPDDLRLDIVHLAMRISSKNLSKIIFELVDNAFKFSAPGTPVIVRSVQEGDRLVITVYDEGRGMTDEEVRLLGAYMQFGRELYEQQGVGLGFTVAKRLVELHGGAIKVDSHPGQGTAISLRFAGAI